MVLPVEGGEGCARAPRGETSQRPTRPDPSGPHQDPQAEIGTAGTALLARPGTRLHHPVWLPVPRLRATLHTTATAHPPIGSTRRWNTSSGCPHGFRTERPTRP